MIKSLGSLAMIVSRAGDVRLVDVDSTRLTEATPTTGDVRELGKRGSNVLTEIVVELLHVRWDGLEEHVAEDGALLLLCNGVVKAHYSGELSLRLA